MINWRINILILIAIGFVGIILGTIYSSYNQLGSLISIVGWIITLIIAFNQLEKTRENNLSLKKAEFKKTLEIEAYKEINKQIYELSNILISISISYLLLPSDLKIYLQYPNYFKFSKIDISNKVNYQIIELRKETGKFLISIESHEIIVYNFIHLTKYLNLKLQDAIELLENFKKYLDSINETELFSKDGQVKYGQECKKVFETLSDIESYLYDYRIELMNAFMSDIFNKKIPNRIPRNPKYKILSEVAIKNEVEDEIERRYQKTLKSNIYNENL